MTLGQANQIPRIFNHYLQVSIQQEVDRVCLTHFQVSTLSDFWKHQNEFLTSENNVGINFWSSKSQTWSKTCFLKFVKHVIHDLAHITRYHGPYPETSEWTFDFRILLSRISDLFSFDFFSPRDQDKNWTRFVLEKQSTRDLKYWLNKNARKRS